MIPIPPRSEAAKFRRAALMLINSGDYTGCCAVLADVKTSGESDVFFMRLFMPSLKGPLSFWWNRYDSDYGTYNRKEARILALLLAAQIIDEQTL